VIVVVSGPGGVGKGTVVERLLQHDPKLWLSRSWTTRPRRVGEAADAYTFVDRATFERQIDAGGFLEHAEFLDNLYGTPIPVAEPGLDVVLEIDVQGAAQVKQHHPEALLIFLEAPSREEQLARLTGRGDPPEVAARRVAKAESEAGAGRALGAHLVVNDQLDQAVADIAAIIAAARTAP